ncbi:hypothetical protein [Paenibacillus donghaensis]|uniref:Uncharacterized protein n=1 Tax=Paenibacillus donghaensis TaxID=414771 RepID=A0A2Z2KGG3_9BACL|nr:hypothetical protein [Paenibacillus donghaensis]ASA23115.1 hypothetical protein B9T62_21310 [Paenibacillus donghaensis]
MTPEILLPWQKWLLHTAILRKRAAELDNNNQNIRLYYSSISDFKATPNLAHSHVLFLTSRNCFAVLSEAYASEAAILRIAFRHPFLRDFKRSAKAADAATSDISEAFMPLIAVDAATLRISEAFMPLIPADAATSGHSEAFMPLIPAEAATSGISEAFMPLIAADAATSRDSEA